ncbi:LacI family DNA-binding transcriptional regulator [Halalkalibacter sp. AB-rgal2]|uniref:LacI family DNA-binding transcriptional regulator n=1 Tax=Halalkalibacter sp. AB-rgal2 TaxID=3242695 RepID=UPI00359E379D
MSKYTIKDVAKEAGVSIATVSRVINGKGKVNATMEQKVQEAIKKLNYEINVIAKNLKEERTKTIGVIIPDISNPHFMTISKGIEDIVHPYGYQLIFGSSNEQPAKEEQLLNLFYGKRVESIVLATSGYNEQTIKKIHMQGTPILLMDRRVEIDEAPMHLVEEDNIDGAYTLTKQLLEFGHTRIGVVNGSLNVSTGSDRYKGFQKAFQEAGVEKDPMLIYNGDFTKESGKKAVEYFMSSKPPSAILSFNNFMTIGVLGELARRGIRVPDDIFIASYDTVEPEELISHMYQILYLRSSPYAMGVRIGKILIESLFNKDDEQIYHEKFTPVLSYQP